MNGRTDAIVTQFESYHPIRLPNVRRIKREGFGSPVRYEITIDIDSSSLIVIPEP
jgi:hypothetical protein